MVLEKSVEQADWSSNKQSNGKIKQIILGMILFGTQSSTTNIIKLWLRLSILSQSSSTRFRVYPRNPFNKNRSATCNS